MKLDTFFENFGLLADAPNGVEKLREMILQLAVQGELVPQDPKDEPASVLLERIQAKKKRLIKEEAIRKNKPFPPILIDEVPYKLPKGWVWERLGNLQRFVNGFAFKSKDYEDSGIGIVRIGNIINGEISTSNMKYVSPIVAEQLDESLYVRKGELLIAMSGATTGKLGFNLTEQQFLINQRVGKLELIKVNKKYTYFYLSTKIKEHLRISVGSAIPNLSTQQINNILFPLPPLREQKRIVEKVDELMALCDELELRKQNVSENCIQLSDASIHKLLTTREPKKFSNHWQRICDNFDLLYSKPENVSKLRQAVLQLAVQGKLVPQDPKDEPASVLLEKIKAEKERLIKEKVIQKTKPPPDVDLDNVPFGLPKGWIWTRWDNISLKIGDVDHKMPIEQKSGIPYVSPRDFGPDNSINFKNAKKISESDFRKLSKKIKPEKQDIIFPRYGTIGENRYVETDIDFLASYSSAVINVLKGFMSSKFIFYYSLSPLVKAEINNYINKTTQANVGIKSIKNFIFPLSPKNEQKRIVAKVDELMALCDELGTRLSKSQTDCDRLMEAAVADILAA